MGKIIFNFPFFSVLCFGMASVGMYSADILRKIFRFLAQGEIIEGLWTSLSLGFAIMLVLAGYHVIDTTLDRLLSNAFIYFGSFVCCWVSHFGAPFIGKIPSKFCIHSDFVILFLAALGFLGLHFGIAYLVRKLDKWFNTQNPVEENKDA